LINYANKGTLFLDEVSELPLSIQKSFLRVLQEKRYRPVGSNMIYESDFRIISATNRNLDKLVREGNFRDDLLYRLKTFTIDIPPLRDRFEDIEGICVYHMSLFAKLYGIKEKRFAPEFFDYLKTYHWPGNIRELVNTIERSLIMAKNESIIYAKHLPDYLRIGSMEQKAVKHSETNHSVTNSNKDDSYSLLPKLKEVRERKIAEIEEDYLKTLFLNTNGDITKAMKISGISKARLYALLKKYKLKPLMFQLNNK
jgi:two-component system, NtrC family, response regulator